MARTNRLLADLRTRLAALGTPERAAKAQAYMKSAMPFHGVPVPEARRVFVEVFRDVAFDDAEAWQTAVRALWDEARFREERYAAITLSGLKIARPFQTMEALPLYEHMIVTGAWWDHVDEIAAHRLGPLHLADPKAMARAMRKWSVDGDMWKRRSSIILQLGHKAKTDTGLLFACIEPSLDSKEFFLRKAIGWALRQHARVDAKLVVDYVRANDARLSGLSKREALKHVE